jgi:hypothetical protein
MIWDPKRLRDRTEHPDPPHRETVEDVWESLLDALEQSDLRSPKYHANTGAEESLKHAVERFRDALRRETLPAETIEQVMKRFRNALRRPKT